LARLARLARWLIALRAVALRVRALPAFGTPRYGPFGARAAAQLGFSNGYFD
jgi:hypothetical protein